MERPDWTNGATEVESVSVDIGFLISDTFYHGPENTFTPEQWQQLRQPLYRPKVELYGDYLLSSELKESADELVRYYADVLRLVDHHKKDINQKSQYFWMRPLIFARGQFAITFPWYDTWQEATHMLDALARPGEGELFHDLDQGWDFRAFAVGNRLFLRQGNDVDDEHFAINANRERLLEQIPSMRERVERLLQELSKALGRDYWSRRR